MGLLLINPFGVPLLNTIILLSSGVSVTWCHYSLLCNKNGFLRLFFTCLLALYFTMFQLIEYYESSFSISDGVFGSIFFLSTGFHGLHVFFGSVFLFFNIVRLLKRHFNFNHHLGLEFDIFFWFIDYVFFQDFGFVGGGYKKGGSFEYFVSVGFYNVEFRVRIVFFVFCAFVKACIV